MCYELPADTYAGYEDLRKRAHEHQLAVDLILLQSDPEYYIKEQKAQFNQLIKESQDYVETQELLAETLLDECEEIDTEIYYENI